ncbi:MAG: 3-keto-disaccharide hydrolase [Bacteroidota bacterium]
MGRQYGSIFTRITPTVKAEKPAGEWQELDITLCNRHVTVKVNGVTVVDNQPLEGATGGAIQSDPFAPGPIYLQGDHTAISFRNLVLTPIIH